MITKYLLAASLTALSLSYFSVRATAVCYITIAIIYILKISKALPFKLKKTWLYIFLLSHIGILLLSIRHEVHATTYIKFFLLSAYSFALLVAIRNKYINKDQFIFSCNAFICIHAIFFLVQFIYYHTSGHYLNFDSYIRESTSTALYETKALSDLLITIRATGLFSEPAFYALTVLPISVLVSLHQKRLTLFTTLGFITSVASLSIAAILVGALSLILLILTSRANKIYIVLVIAFAAVSFPLISTVYNKRIIEAVDYDAIYSRKIIFNEFSIRGLENNLFGSGFFWDESKQTGKTPLWGFHIRDSSFFVYTFYTAGLAGLLTLLGTITLIARRNPKYAAAICALLLFKFHVVSGSLWLTFIICAALMHFEKIHRSNLNQLQPITTLKQ